MPQGRLTAPLLAMTASLALAGCATTSSDPTALIPADVRASVIAEDRMASGSISVNEMLSRARDGEAGAPSSTPAEAATTGAGTGATTGAAVAAVTTAPRTPAPVGVPDPPEPKAFFEFTFDGPEDQPSGAAKDAFARKVKSARLSAKTQVTILSGPGQGTTAFDQALLANRRVRNVRSLLPEGWQASQVYNPDFPPDTVRIVLDPAT